MKRYQLSLFILLLVLVSLNFVNAELFSIQSAIPSYINRTVNTLVNFTINNTGTLNITQVIIQLPQGTTYYADSNGTSATNTNFINTSGPPPIQLKWINTSGAAVIQNISQVKSFWFNVSFTSAGNQIFTVVTNDTSNIGNTSTTTFTVNFAFSGYVKNETVGIIENATVEIYQFVAGQNSPPTETLEARTNSTSTGLFTFASINGSAQQYKIKIYYKNSSGSVIKTGPVLPPFPSSIFYGMCPIGNCPFSPNLNGTTFYLQPAATLSLSAINTSGASQLFGYEVMDQLTGMSVESNIMTNVSNANITVPIGRTYTVMILRNPWNGNSGFQFSNNCDGTFFNNTHCPTPPKSNSTTSPTTAGQLINVQVNLTIVRRYMYGCINVVGNRSSIAGNITNIYPKLLPWEGFIPPIKADTGDINLSSGNQLNYSVSITPINCSGHVAYYNISLMNAIYLLEFYGKNSTSGSGGEYVGGIYNISLVNSDIYQNITLRPLLGGYPSGIGLGEVNVTKMKVNIQNSTGGAASNIQNVEFIVKNSNFGTLHYIIGSDEMANGTFYAPLMNNTEWAKVTIFANGPPIERFLNLSSGVSENNISTPSGELGFRKVLANGTLVQTNVSEIPIQMTFLLNTASCSALSEFRSPSSSCIITNMSAENFNPLKVLAAGKVNMIMKITSTNVSIVYHNFDMFLAKPPTNTLINENATSYGTQTQLWQFGSFTPSHVYNNITILIPYSGNSSASNYLNESWTFNMKIPILYKQNLQTQEQLDVAWNSSRGDTSTNLTDEFTDYNASYYRAYLDSTGITCGTDLAAACYIDTSNNIIFMKIPHFSGVSPSITGTAPAVTSTTTPGAGGGAATAANKTKSYSWIKITPGAATIWKLVDKDLGIKQISITVNNPAQNVKITVTKYDGKPAEVTKEKSGKVYKYLKIEEQNLGKNLSKAILTIQVEKSWLTNKSLTKDKIALFKFDNSSSDWKELTTTYKEEDTTNYYYDTELTSFSYFAIAEKIVVTTPTCTPSWSCTDWSACQNEARTRTCTDSNTCGTNEGKPTESEACEAEGKKPIGKTTWAIIIGAIIAVIVIILIYTLYKKKKY